MMVEDAKDKQLRIENARLRAELAMYRKGARIGSWAAHGLWRVFIGSELIDAARRWAQAVQQRKAFPLEETAVVAAATVKRATRLSPIALTLAVPPLLLMQCQNSLIGQQNLAIDHQNALIEEQNLLVRAQTAEVRRQLELNERAQDAEAERRWVAALFDERCSGMRPGAMVDEGATAIGSCLSTTPPRLRQAAFEGLAARSVRDFSSGDLRRLRLIGVDARGWTFDSATLREVDLSSATLRRASLRNADLRAGIFVEADFSAASLVGADLRGARFHDADLSDADLRDADLRGAHLCGANLEGANLNGARLDRASFWSIETTVVSTRPHIQDSPALISAKASTATTWPDGFLWATVGVSCPQCEG